MRRRLFTFCSAVSLLLFVAACAMWVRSCWIGDVVFRCTEPDPRPPHANSYYLENWEIATSNGGAAILHERDEYVIDERIPFPEYAVVERHELSSDWVHMSISGSYRGYPPTPAANTFGNWAVGGFQWYAVDLGHWGHPTTTSGPLHALGTRSVKFPLWFPALITTILPAIWTKSALRRRAARAMGRCVFCGYDLRATPERCPECGREAEASTA